MNGDIDPRIALAAMLIQLGIVTVQQIRELFAKDLNDDEKLAEVMTEVDARIARRA